MKKVVPFVFALTISAAPVLAWGGGDCPYSKKGGNQEVSTEKTEKAETSKTN